VGSAEVGMRAEIRQEGGLVVRRASHPTIREAGPGRNSITRSYQILGTVWRAEIFVGVAARSRIRSAGQDGVGSGVVQSIVQPGDHARSVAEGRVGGYIFDPFAVDPDLAPVTQALQVFASREGAAGNMGRCRSFCRHGWAPCVGDRAPWSTPYSV